ncbi:MAG: hypothetical protein Q9162_003149 [Coniocarpon cinnabarinum]
MCPNPKSGHQNGEGRSGACRQLTTTTPAADLVTETDKAVEDMISATLRERYPDFAFMGEETYKPGDRLTAQPTFVVDPIDGTTNFVHAYPYVSISLGLAVDKKPVIGVVFNPYTDTLYSAIDGKGAFLNLKTPLPLKIDSTTTAKDTRGTHTMSGAQRDLEPLTDLDQALVAIEWGSDRSGSDFQTKCKTFANLTAAKEDGGGMVHGLRSYGSAALNLCGVAEASLDVYMESGCWAWDVTAGRWDVNVDDRRYLAVRKGTDRKVVEQVWGCMAGQLSYSA